MPTGKEVVWLNSKQEISEKLEVALSDASETVMLANQWFEKINHPPAADSSQKIWTAIEKIYNK